MFKMFDTIEITAGPAVYTPENVAGMFDNPTQYYVVESNGTVALSGASAITPTATGLVAGVLYKFLYRAELTTTDNTTHFLTICGYKLTEEELQRNSTITARYTGSAWEVRIMPDFEESGFILGTHIKDRTITTAKIALLAITDAEINDVDGSKIAAGTVDTTQLADASVTDAKIAPGVNGDKLATGSVALVKLQDKTRGHLLVFAGASGAATNLDNSGAGNIIVGQGAGSDLLSVGMSGDVTMNSSGVTAIGALKILEAMINTGAVTATKIATGAVTADKLASDVQKQSHVFLVSFETGEQADNEIRMPYKGQVDEIHYTVVKAIAGTDDATITAEDNGGSTMGGAAITIPASTAINTNTNTAIASNNTFNAGDILKFITAKATAGGKVLLTVNTTRTI